MDRIANGRRLHARDARHVLTVAELLLAYLRFAKDYYRSDNDHGTFAVMFAAAELVRFARRQPE